MSFYVALSHDVDRIHKTHQYLTQDLKNLKLKNFRNIFSRNYKPYKMFQKVMEVEEKYSVRSTFFFLQESMSFVFWPPKKWALSVGRYNFYDVEKEILELDYNGWEIGLHGSYYSYVKKDLLVREKKELEKVLGKEVIGIRQHYLNLEIPKTWEIQKEAGFLYDASYGKIGDIGYIDKNNVFIDRNSKMVIIPLTFMESYLFKKFNYDLNKIWNTVLDYINKAENTNSLLSILWHQRYFNNNEFLGYSEIYEKIIKECKARNAVFLTHVELYNKFINEYNG